MVGHGALPVEGVHLAAQVVENHPDGVRELHLGEPGEARLLARAQELVQGKPLRHEVPVMQELATGEFHAVE